MRVGRVAGALWEYDFKKHETCTAAAMPTPPHNLSGGGGGVIAAGCVRFVLMVISLSHYAPANPLT